MVGIERGDRAKLNQTITNKISEKKSISNSYVFKLLFIYDDIIRMNSDSLYLHGEH